ncbi:hypothetical protein B296_00026692 [Ensete ventricosum]|uniref:Uncharacterized protein n=1 Tax=Ensete ventricosum TaxID=4639 RepID=A0A427A006_ENSVE|nr:hypothetical protein B296_00026692 [Ensete ventricosum]
MTGDGRLLACSGMNLLCFENNGTVAWIVPLQYTCRLDIAPVNDDRGKVAFIAPGFVSNTEGQVYSLYIRSPHFRWIQDFSSIDKLINIIPGNNGHLYLIFPKKAVVMSLYVATGNTSWRNNVGPLSAETILPVVDSNGKQPKTASDSVIQATPVLDCSGFAVYVPQTVMEGKTRRTIGQSRFLVLIRHAITILFFLLIVGNESAALLFLFFQFVILLILGVTVRSCCVFWRKKKLQEHGLGRFLEKRVSGCKILHPALTSSLLTSLPHQMPEKAAEDATNDEALDRLGEAATAKEGVVRKLSTSYSLGRDRTGSRRGSILPVYDDVRKKSHSFHCARRESVTIFNTYSNTSSSDESRNSSSYHHESGSGGCSDEAGPSSRVAAAEGEGSSDAASEAKTFANPMFVEDESDSVRHSRDEELMREPMQEGVGVRRMWLKRRRTLSSTN